MYSLSEEKDKWWTSS